MVRVLVVDDSPVVRKIARRILEAMGLRSFEASDGREALAACSVSMPEAILVDANMPTLDGYEFSIDSVKCQAATAPRSSFA